MIAAVLASCISFSNIVNAVEIGQVVPVRVVCKSKATVERHLALIELERGYAMANDALKESVQKDECVAGAASIGVPVAEIGKAIEFVDSDGDAMRVTVVGLGGGLWTLTLEVLGKEG